MGLDGFEELGAQPSKHDWNKASVVAKHNVKDVDGDGIPDLRLHFVERDSGVDPRENDPFGMQRVCVKGDFFAAVSDKSVSGCKDVFVISSKNLLPSVFIVDPSSGDSFGSGSTVNFVGVASDLEDGDLTANIKWFSDIDGFLGQGGNISEELSDGTHVIRAEI